MPADPRPLCGHDRNDRHLARKQRVHVEHTFAFREGRVVGSLLQQLLHRPLHSAECRTTGGGASADAAHAGGAHWRDLRTRRLIREQYFKPYPVCRWAQPAVEAALSLQRAHRFDADDVTSITLESFREAIDLGSQCLHPVTTDEAQYSLTCSVAAALVFGRLGAAEVTPPRLSDPRVARLIDATT